MKLTAGFVNLGKAVAAALLLTFGRRDSVDDDGTHPPYDAAGAAAAVDYLAEHFKV